MDNHHEDRHFRAHAHNDEDLTLACKGKVEVQGRGDPIVQEMTASVVVGPKYISISFLIGPCPITSNCLNGIDFECPLPKLSGGWFWNTTGYLDRYNGDLEITTTKVPPSTSDDKFGTAETYQLTCKLGASVVPLPRRAVQTKMADRTISNCSFDAILFLGVGEALTEHFPSREPADAQGGIRCPLTIGSFVPISVCIGDLRLRRRRLRVATCSRLTKEEHMTSFSQFDPATKALLDRAYDAAWRELEAAGTLEVPPALKAEIRAQHRAQLTRQLLDAVHRGERDFERLKAFALDRG